MSGRIHRRVAALYDIHGNLPALEAVLREVRDAAADMIVVGGDVCPGPMSAEALAALRAIDIPVRGIAGNGERDVLDLGEGRVPARVPEPYRIAMQWVARQLSGEDRREIAAWPSSTSVEVETVGLVFFCHATPDSDTAIFTRETPAERLAPLFDTVTAGTVVCGHTHMQFDRRIGGVRVVNAGSVGMPFGDRRACWLLIGPDVQLRRTEYDVEAAAARVRSTAYPQAEEFALRSILQPPSEREMLDLFARAELK